MFDPIPEHVQTNFQTLLRAAEAGDLALVSCLDAATREPRYVLTAMNRQRDGSVAMTPFGHMCPADNPFEAYEPPHA